MGYLDAGCSITVVHRLRESVAWVQLPAPRLMNNDNTIKKIKEVEIGINKNLYLICGIVTLLTMIMIATEFFTRGAFPPTRIAIFYLGILIVYSLHKELVRWLGEKRVERQGEYFVYGWIIFAVILHIINFLSKDFFAFSAKGEPTDTLQQTCILALEVLLIFFITRTSKLIKIFLQKDKKT